MGVGDNMNGLVWVMEWTSVLVIVLRIPKKKEARQNTGKQRGRAAQQKITVQIKLFSFINRSENKLKIHFLDFYRHFPLNQEVRA